MGWRRGGCDVRAVLINGYCSRLSQDTIVAASPSSSHLLPCPAHLCPTLFSTSFSLSSLPHSSPSHHPYLLILPGASHSLLILFTSACILLILTFPPPLLYLSHSQSFPPPHLLNLFCPPLISFFISTILMTYPLSAPPICRLIPVHPQPPFSSRLLHPFPSARIYSTNYTASLPDNLFSSLHK